MVQRVHEETPRTKNKDARFNRQGSIWYGQHNSNQQSFPTAGKMLERYGLVLR